MVNFPFEQERYKWLRVLLGAMVVLLVAAGLLSALYRWRTQWSPPYAPGAVPVPVTDAVSVKLQDHPRLLAASGAIEALTADPQSAEYKRLIRKAEQFYIEYKNDPHQGDTIYPEYFALAWSVTGDNKYLDATKDMLFNVCKLPPWKRRPESANFYKIELAYAMGVTYDILYDVLTFEERKRVEEKLIEVLDGLLWHLQGEPAPPFWHDAPHSNYFVAQHSAAGFLALCLGDAYPNWDMALAFSYNGLERSIEQLEKDGGWIEGLRYQDFCWGQHGLLFLNALRINGGPDRLSEEWYETSVRFALAGILPSGEEQVNFGDNTKDPIASFGYLLRAKSFFDSEFLDSYLDQYLPEPDYPLVMLDALLFEIIASHDPSLPLGEFPEPDPCQYFPGIEWAMLREDWTNPDGFFLASKAGYGGWDHNHVDQGTFILAFNSNTLIKDSGKGNFADRQQHFINMIFGGPLGHNVFFPATNAQMISWPDFTMYSENFQYRQGDADIKSWDNTDQFIYFSMNLDHAYPSEDLNLWRRHFLWWKPTTEHPGGIVLILDETDSQGLIQFMISPNQIDKREEITIVDWHDTNDELGIYVYLPEYTAIISDMETYSEDMSVYRIAPAQSQNIPGFGLTQSLTVLLLNDGLISAVCEGFSDENTIGAFVDGFEFKFEKDENGDWHFIAP